MKYKLTKTSIKPDHTSLVSVGQTVTGNKIKVIRKLKHPLDIELGDEVYIADGHNYIKTSPVQRTDISEDGLTLTIKTETSTYELKKVKDK